MKWQICSLHLPHFSQATESWYTQDHPDWSIFGCDNSLDDIVRECSDKSLSYDIARWLSVERQSRGSLAGEAGVFQHAAACMGDSPDVAVAQCP